MGILGDALSGFGYVLDTPGALARGVLAGRPFSRVSPEELASEYGYENLGPLGSFGVSMATDPLTYIGMGGTGAITKALRGGSAAAKAVSAGTKAAHAGRGTYLASMAVPALGAAVLEENQERQSPLMNALGTGLMVAPLAAAGAYGVSKLANVAKQRALAAAPAAAAQGAGAPALSGRQVFEQNYADIDRVLKSRFAGWRDADDKLQEARIGVLQRLEDAESKGQLTPESVGPILQNSVRLGAIDAGRVRTATGSPIAIHEPLAFGNRITPWNTSGASGGAMSRSAALGEHTKEGATGLIGTRLEQLSSAEPSPVGAAGELTVDDIKAVAAADAKDQAILDMMMDKMTGYRLRPVKKFGVNESEIAKALGFTPRTMYNRRQAMMQRLENQGITPETVRPARRGKYLASFVVPAASAALYNALRGRPSEQQAA
jgi:hypothetical protein